MQFKSLFVLALAIMSVLVMNVDAGSKKHHKVIIHVPHHIKTIKHTHTIYKIIHHKEKDHGHHDHEHAHHYH